MSEVPQQRESHQSNAASSERDLAYAHLTPEEEIDAKNWVGLSNAVRERSIAALHEGEKGEFRFKPELLRSSEGRAVVFREMVRMFNDVRKKRDALGYGEKRSAEGELVHKVRKNLHNDEFDGFPAFRSRYGKLKKIIAEFSNRPEAMEGADVPLTEEELKAFADGFEFLQSYYNRTRNFEGSQEEAGEQRQEAEAVSEAQEQPGAPEVSETVAAESAEEEHLPELREDTALPEKAAVSKAYEERLALRNEWREKKQVYEEAYAAYLDEKEDRTALQKIGAWWRKDKLPESVRELEQEYQDSRRAYAVSLSASLFRREANRTLNEASLDAGNAPEERRLALRAALANRFVIHAALDKLQVEKEHVPDERSMRVFEDLKGAFKKHGKSIRIAGYVAVGGIALASGGIGAAIATLGSKAVQAKLAAGATLVGATGGAFIGNSLGDALIRSHERKRDAAGEKAQQRFSVAELDALEKEYADRYRGYRNAVRDKKALIAAGTLAGGALGALAAGSLDEVSDLPDRELPQEPEPIPPEITPEPEVEAEPETPSVEPKDKPEAPEAPEVSEEPPQEQEPVEEKPLENIPKGEDMMHVPETTAEEPLPDVSEPEEEGGIEVEPIMFTFTEGNRIDTVSEALFETWKDNPALTEDALSQKEFLAQMYTAIAELEKDPVKNAELLEQMGIVSGDIDKVQVGQSINLQPFFEYLNTKA